MNTPKEKQESLHGNLAKVDPRKAIESLFATNPVTLSDHNKKETPVVNKENVALAKEFVDENEK